jgi:peptide/nickel transport system substrate-binding protein
MRSALLLLCAVLLTACGRAEFRTSNTFVIVQQREPRTLNPELENGTNSMELGALLFSYLLTWNDRGRLVGDVATAVPTYENGGVSRDGLTIIYHLRHGVRFSDGVALTAADCVYTIRAILNPSNDVQSRYGYDRIASATAPDPYTLVLHLRKPFAPLVSLVLSSEGFPILPKHELAAYPNFNAIAFDQLPVGSGPYVVAQWVHGDHIDLDANPRYFRGAPSIAHLMVRFVPDATTATNELRTGEADGFFDDLDTNDYPQLRTIPAMRVTLTPLNEVGALIFNTADPATRDARVRRALAEAIDTRRLVDEAYRGTQLAHDAGRGIFQWAYDEAAYPDVPYDPQNARRLLRDAGWNIGADGIRHKEGAPLQLVLILQANVVGDEIFASAVRQYELAVGAEVTLRAFNVDRFVAPPSEGGPVYSGNFQMALYPFENGNDPDVTDQFACSRVPPNGYNKSRFCDPAADALMARALRTYDPVARKTIYAQLQRILSRELPIEIIFQTREIDAFTTRLHGESVSPNGPFWNVYAWRLSRSHE